MKNGSFNEDQVRDLLRAEVDRAGTMKKWATKHDLSVAYICDVLHGRRGISDSIVAALGLRRIVHYERIKS